MAPKTRQTTAAAVPGFFKSIPASVYSPSFYAGIAGRSFWKGFWYLVGVSFFILVAWTLVLTLVPYLKHKETVQSTLENVIHFYPEELVLTIQDGKVSSNVPEPYYFKFTDAIPTENWNAAFKEGFEEGVSEDMPASVDLEDFNLVVIDTQTPYSIEQFYKYETIAWLTYDAVYVMSESNKIEAIPLAEAPDMVVNKVLVDDAMESIWGSVKNALPILAVFFFACAFIGVVVFRMIYLLFFALVLFVACSLMKLPYDFGAAYKIGFYAITLSSVLMVLLTAITPIASLSAIPFLFTIVSLIVAIVNLNAAKNAGLIKEAKEA